MEKWSAILDSFNERSESNHMDICKFPNATSIGYKRAAGHIIRLVEEANEQTVQSESLSDTTEQSQMPFPQMDPGRLLLQRSDEHKREARCLREYELEEA